MNMNKIMSIVAIVLFLLISLVSCDEAKVSDTTIYQDDKTMMTEIPDSISNKINKQDTVLKACSEKIGNLVVSQNESNDKIEEIQKQLDAIKKPNSIWNILIIVSFIIGVIALVLAICIMKNSSDLNSIKNLIFCSKEFKHLKNKVEDLCEVNRSGISTSYKDLEAFNARLHSLEQYLSSMKRSAAVVAVSPVKTSPEQKPSTRNVLYAKDVSNGYIMGVTESQQDSSIFKITLETPNKGNFDIVSLQEIQQCNGLEEILEYVGSGNLKLSEAKGYDPVKPGACQKVGGYWKVTEKLKIRIY